MTTPGELIAGRYRIERLLARGGMGSVHVATDEKFGVKVALKLAAASGAAHDEFKARFAREAQIGNRLGRADGFVRALDWGSAGDGVQLYLAMDLVDGAKPLDLKGGTLAERLGRLLTASRLVASAHAQGVIHRDLKPANVLQAADGSIHITDFGLAKVMGEGDEPRQPDLSLTQTGVGMGTPTYMAPEQFDDAKSVDAKADAYALGVMLFEALTTGGKPFDTRDVRRLWREHDKVLTGQRTLPRARAVAPEVPLPLDELCAHTMAVDPAQRLDSAEFVRRLGAEVARLAGDEGTVTVAGLGSPRGAADEKATVVAQPETTPPEPPPTHASPSALRTVPPPGAETVALPPEDDIPILPTVDVHAPTAAPPPRGRLVDELPAATLTSMTQAAPDAPPSRRGFTGCCCCLLFLLAMTVCCPAGIVVDLGGIQGTLSSDLRHDLGRLSYDLFDEFDGLAELEGTDPVIGFTAPLGPVQGPFVKLRFWVEDAALVEEDVQLRIFSKDYGAFNVAPTRTSWGYRSDFEHALPLRPGSYTVTAIAGDVAGNMGMTINQITVTKPPRIGLRPPKDLFGTGKK